MKKSLFCILLISSVIFNSCSDEDSFLDEQSVKPIEKIQKRNSDLNVPYTIELVSVPPSNKLTIVALVKELFVIDLFLAKMLVDNPPKLLPAVESYSIAKEYMQKLSAEGATVRIAN